MRKIIVHFHIFKNAGSTVDYILRRNFHDRLFGLESPVQTSSLPVEKGLEFIRNHPQLQALTSHQLAYPLPAVANLAIYPIFFLRHPIDRIGSIYRYERLTKNPSAYADKAKELSFREYLLWLLPSGAGVMNNYQMRRLSRSLPGEKAIIGPARFELALQRLSESRYFGLVDRFDDSIRSLREYLQDDFPGLDYSYKIQLKTSEIESSAERIARIKAEIGDDVYAKLLEINQLDLALYEQAVKLFDERFAKLSGASSYQKKGRAWPWFMSLGGKFARK